MTVLDERFDLELLREATRYQQWILSWFGPGLSGRVAEVGPGIGNFTRWIAERAEQVVAIEPEPAMCGDIKALDLPNVEVVCSMLEDLTGAETTFDSVFLCNVLEHIVDDAAALSAACRLARPGGAVCVVVPAHPTLFGSLDERYGHLRRYRRLQIQDLMRLAGLRDLRTAYFNPVGALGWLIVSRIGRRKHLSPGSVRLSERLAVPLGEQLQRLGPMPFGQSVVAIGRTAGPALSGA